MMKVKNHRHLKKKMKPNNILIIHGFESNSKEHWFMRFKEKFEKLGYKVFVPDMPGAFFPKKDEWIKRISDFKPDGNWILIGHSLGGDAILRYLEIADKKVAEVLLIATPYESMKFGAIENFFEKGFDWDAIKNKSDKIIVINEDNDPAVPLEHGRQLSRQLGCQLIVRPGYVHFDKIDINLLERLITGSRKSG